VSTQSGTQSSRREKYGRRRNGWLCGSSSHFFNSLVSIPAELRRLISPKCVAEKNSTGEKGWDPTVVAEERGGQGRHRLVLQNRFSFSRADSLFQDRQLSYFVVSIDKGSSRLTCRVLNNLYLERMNQNETKILQRKRDILYHSLSTIFFLINAVVSAHQDFPPVCISWIHTDIFLVVTTTTSCFQGHVEKDHR